MSQNGLQIDVEDSIIKLVAKRSRGHLRDAHMLLEQYKMMSKEDFIDLFRSCSELYIKFIVAIISDHDELIEKLIEKMLHYKLDDLKIEYENFTLNIIKSFYIQDTSDDKYIKYITTYFKHKKNAFIDILNDYRNYDMFTSDARFASLIWLLADKIKQLK